MPIHNRIADFHDELTTWRRDIHAHPELRYEEHRTAELVANRLESWGVEVHRGIAETGVVGVLNGRGTSSRAIGLRADMDALPILEQTGLAYQSTVEGKMHACGHDGHTVMLLGAARYLAETRNFDGTVYFIFQPAEEGGAGAKMMIDEGLFDRFPCDTVWGMHNAPHLPAGTIATRPGPTLAAADKAFITIRGRGAHAARPHDGVDPIAVGLQLYQGLQLIVARNVDPLHSAVVSVCEFHAGTALNVIPETASLTISIRTFDAAVRKLVERRVRALCDGVAAAHGCTIELDYQEGYPALVNGEQETEFASKVAEEVVGAAAIDRNGSSSMGSEDFAFMLNERPGAFIWIGGGVEGKDFGLHHPSYDFNDEILPIGASYWARLVETSLPRKG
ncbi:M20 aminoacylase family protein [Chelativorans xinjiangense]|uniref:M20 aminoacylase family protein n=1 Tax=Chelativorans xinjiangense TaxID=2681485 RepID=UPI00135933AD|nr:M20 aminoacylase family protein [Chelativorans xinjiangense]